VLAVLRHCWAEQPALRPSSCCTCVSTRRMRIPSSKTFQRASNVVHADPVRSLPLTVFAAKTHGIFFSRRPGVLLACAAVFATSTSTLVSWKSPFHDMEPIPGPLVGIMWLYCLAWFWLRYLARGLAYTAVKHSTFSLGGESVETKERKKKWAQRASLRRLQ